MSICDLPRLAGVPFRRSIIFRQQTRRILLARRRYNIDNIKIVAMPLASWQ
jgi:hypothetical protein